MTLKQCIYALLAADAQVTDSGHLGDMLGLSASAPYGVYFQHPPEDINFESNSVITFFINSMAGRFPREIYFNVTAWGDNFEAILNRCYALLHNASLNSLSDYTGLMIKWNYSGPELYSDELRVYSQQQRYLIKGIKS
jgi:hypothetical protein